VSSAIIKQDKDIKKLFHTCVVLEHNLNFFVSIHNCPNRGLPSPQASVCTSKNIIVITNPRNMKCILGCQHLTHNLILIRNHWTQCHVSHCLCGRWPLVGWGTY